MQNDHGNISQLCTLLSEHPSHHLQHQMLLFRDLLMNGFSKQGGALPNQVSPISAPSSDPQTEKRRSWVSLLGASEVCGGGQGQANCKELHVTLWPEIGTKILLTGAKYLLRVICRWGCSFPEARSTEHIPQRNKIKSTWNFSCSRQAA